MKHLVAIAVKNYFTPKERVLKGFFNNWGSKSNQADAMVSEEDIEWSITYPRIYYVESDAEAFKKYQKEILSKRNNFRVSLSSDELFDVSDNYDYFKNKDSYNYSYEMTELNPTTFTIEGLKKRMTAIDFRDWFWGGFNNVGPNNSLDTKTNDLDTKINNADPDNLLDLPI